METIIIKIEKGIDQYGAWVEGIQGIYGAGDTVKEVKKNIIDAIELYEKHNAVMPKVLNGDYTIKWEFDTASFLEYISVVFTKSGLERITGINQKQLGHYSSGLKKPRKNQIEKIDAGIHRFIDELNQIHLI
ncbi:MAG TPA: antitoxin HicB [Paludibacter sp.]|nr:antitoxin HicB [Paludibacter sp.]